MDSAAISDRSGPQSLVFGLISAAHGERTQERALQLLRDALDICEKWNIENDDLSTKLLIVQVLSELAVEEDTPLKRGERWRRALRLLENAARTQNSTLLACSYGLVAVDCFQDLLSDIDFQSRTSALRAARDYVNVQLHQTVPDGEAAALLARKSSLLRQLAMTDFIPQDRFRRLEESFRCATKAFHHVRDSGTLLELALSEASLGAHEGTDEKYALRLRSAEAHLSDELLLQSELAQLSLARLFRLTFRPFEACEQFRMIVGSAENIRRTLRDSYIYAEAAIQLWYRTYPKEMVEAHLTAARSLVEEALASGIRTGRHIVDLCQLGAILDGSQGGVTALEELFTGEGHVSWEQALRLAAQGAVENNPESGFVLGINDGSVWTGLGTFIYKFLRDDELAEHLYRYAVKLDPRDPIPLTNLARLLVRKGDAASISEARRLLQKAQSFADRRFMWWRTVDAELKAKESAISFSKNLRKAPTLPLAPPKNLKEITISFKATEALDNLQKRGYRLQELVFEVAKLTVGIAETSYRMPRVGGGEFEIDGFFRHGPDRYRVECKWERHPIEPGASVEALKGMAAQVFTPHSNFRFEQSASLEFENSSKSIGLQVADTLGGFCMRYVKGFFEDREQLSPMAHETYDLLRRYTDPIRSTGLNLVTSTGQHRQLSLFVG